MRATQPLRRLPRAGPSSRVWLPQPGPAERRPGRARARAAHWPLAPSLPGRCVRIGRQGPKRRAGLGVGADAAVGFMGGLLGLCGPFVSLTFGRALPAPGDPGVCTPGFLFRRRHKMAALGGGATAWGPEVGLRALGLGPQVDRWGRLSRPALGLLGRVGPPLGSQGPGPLSRKPSGCAGSGL